MRLVCSLVLVTAALLAGCSRNKPAATDDPYGAMTGSGRAASAKGKNLIVTPTGGTKGRVALVNPTARYVVLSFPIGYVPPAESQLSIYREGLKVGEVKVTGPTMDHNTVGDITVGEARSGDEVRGN